ncbi:MAG TPA: cyclic nucleotide-binding domain-containing protein [Flavobacteriales bacterium]|nr:cyclic nucleotide-binding domain-containing protein [Flavobacteriales bacterium]
MKKILIHVACLFIVLGLNQFALADTQHDGQDEKTTIVKSVDNKQGVTHETHNENAQESGHKDLHEDGHETAHEGGHKGGMEPLLFIIIALIIGAATRHFLKKSPLPFTVTLLLIGIIMGVMANKGFFDGVMEPFKLGLHWAGNIDPHLILFVFLPILIFEAAFALDVHVFKKSLGNAIILAVPGIVVALVLTAAIIIVTDMLGWGFEGWNWAYALMFGSVVSATDPVAVVALLKDLGASKKLGTLIEGESLLNDGTAIVIFMVIYAPIVAISFSATGEVLVPDESSSPFIEFLRVGLGGIVLGIVVGYVVVAWVKRVFNDVFVEISVIIAAAYFVFYAAEEFLHVSGVLALVSYGLVMAGVGKTRISPEVGHFLHEFWELAAFIANVLIFIIVGVVIAERGVFDATANDYLLLLIIYVGIHVVRAIVILMFYPFMKRTGYGLPKKDAIVVWYGALRGAIGLALALIVAGIDPKKMAIYLEIDESQAVIVIDQFLFLISGVVALTLLVNATTIKMIVNGLGLTKIPAVKAMMMTSAYNDLKVDTDNSVELMKGDRFLSGANWSAVRDYLPSLKAPDISPEELAAMDTLAETRRRILEKEKSSYWHQFNDGLLGPQAVRRLSDGVSETLDLGGKVDLSQRDYLDKLWGTPKFLTKLQAIPLIGTLAKNELSNRLAMSYDIAQGFIVAQEEVVKLVDSMTDDKEGGTNKSLVDEVKVEIETNRIRGLHYIKGIREVNPEIAAAIETKQAIRSVLNHERSTIKKLQNQGRIEDDESEKMISSVEERMKKLMDSPPAIKLPAPHELLKEIPWLQGLDADTFKKVEATVEDKIYQSGEALMKEGGGGDGLFIIARGSVNVTVGDTIVDIVGQGSVIGEMAVLTGVKRTATVTADTQVTALWLPTGAMQEIMSNSDELEYQLWDTAGKRFAMNMLGNLEPYKTWRQIQFRKWLSEGKVVSASVLEDNKIDLRKQIGVLLKGTAVILSDDAQEKIGAPLVLTNQLHSLSDDAWVFVRAK